MMLIVLMAVIFSVTSIFFVAYAAEQNSYYADKYFERKELLNGGYQEIKHIYLEDVPIADIIYDSTTGETKTVYITPDHLNSASIITDEQGQVEELHDYYPFGDQNYQQQASDSVVNNLYTGKELDSESSLYYYGARYYDSAVGKFISIDPYNQRLPQLDDQKLKMFLTNPQQLNFYSYTSNNPVNRVDPNGELDERAIFNPTSPSQLLFWQGVSEAYLRRKEGFYASAALLQHSLSWKPDNITINGYNQNSYGKIIDQIQDSDDYKNFVRDRINVAEARGLNEFYFEGGQGTDNPKDYLIFGEGDLKYSLHRSSIYLTGSKTDDGSWRVGVMLNDTYDYELKFKDYFNDFKATVGANSAFLSQQLGVVSNYDISIIFDDKIYK